MTETPLLATILDELACRPGGIDRAAIQELIDRQLLPDAATIGEVADALGMSPHAIRYYERIGLLAVGRDASGTRVFTSADAERLLTIQRMRLAGMPIADLTHYMELVDAGADGTGERLDVLLEHREVLARRILEYQFALACTDYKIALLKEDA